MAKDDDAGMVSMKRSAADKAEEKSGTPMEATAPDYPWGLCITIDGDELAKLGIELPKVGQKFHLDAMAVCTMARQEANASTSGDASEYKCCSLQITDLSIMPPGAAEGA